MTTIGVCAIIPPPLGDDVRRLWQRFEREFGCRAVQEFGHPDLAFQGGQCTDQSALRAEISLWASAVDPLEIEINGVGCFENPSPVVFLSVVPTPELQRIHCDLNRIVAHHCTELFPEYLPERWVPHVTIAMQDITVDVMRRALAEFDGYQPRWRQVLPALSLVARNAGSGSWEIIESWTLSERSKV
jgi:2'-5' RNA ligase